MQKLDFSESLKNSPDVLDTVDFQEAWTEQQCLSFINLHGIGLDLWNSFYDLCAGFDGDSEILLDSEHTLERVWRLELMRCYCRRFLNRSDRYALQWIDDKGGCQYTVKTAPNHDFIADSFTLVGRHLLGIHTLSIPAISEDGLCRWACWDSDTGDGDLLKIKGGLEKLDLHSVRESVRPGRDGHLWLFFERAVRADDLLSFNGELLRQIGVSPNAIEFFPKSATNHSQIRAPLGNTSQR